MNELVSHPRPGILPSRRQLGHWFRYHFSTLGLLIGTLLFSVSLTPSLLPRTSLVQGILSGCAFAAGYGIGSSVQWIAEFLGVRLPRGKAARALTWLVAAGCLLLALLTLNYTLVWQNSVRDVMGMPLVETNQPPLIAAVALLPALLLILAGKLVVTAVRLVWRGLRLLPYVPRRVALLASVAIVLVLGGMLVDGVLLRSALRAADGFYERLDAVVPQDQPAPTRPEQTGSSSSLVDWDTIGRDARVYVQSGPDAPAISAATGRPAIDPLRTYVALRSAPTVEQRVELALAEMDRVGAWNRSVLLLINPVGTGWVDPAAIDTLEYLHDGDVASVAVQYSYLTSWLSLVVEPNYGIETAQLLFNAVYDRWTAMSPASRPRLYLHGLSLGAIGSQASVQIFDILDDPINGALWAGSPFSSPLWLYATGNRNPGSPMHLPILGNSKTVRFADQDAVANADLPWGPMRMVFLQYASDPITFFDPNAAWREPVWMVEPRGRDVSPALNWYPVVTFLQLLLDMALAQTSPVGYGHVYAASDYLDAWIAVTEPAGWTAAELAAFRSNVPQPGYLTP
jgi:uncharacterized membrane protein